MTPSWLPGEDRPVGILFREIETQWRETAHLQTAVAAGSDLDRVFDAVRAENEWILDFVFPVLEQLTERAGKLNLEDGVVGEQLRRRRCGTGAEHQDQNDAGPAADCGVSVAYHDIVNGMCSRSGKRSLSAPV